jgi:hypothetical protein
MSSDEYQLLLDDTVDPGDLPVLELPGQWPVADVADALESYFAADPDSPAVTVRLGADHIGVSSRARIQALSSLIVRSLGDGDGATLPGASLRYRILRFWCPRCDARTRRIHVDARDLPECPRGHGVMELES